MTTENDKLLTDLFQSAHKAYWEKEAEEKLDTLNRYRYDFALKAQQQSLHRSDLFLYLQLWAEHKIALRSSYDMSAKDFPALRNDCTHNTFSPLVKKHLLERICWVKERMGISETMGTELAQQALFGTGEVRTPLEKVRKNVLIRIANESGWLPFELQGLEHFAHC